MLSLLLALLLQLLFHQLDKLQVGHLSALEVDLVVVIAQYLLHGRTLHQLLAKKLLQVVLGELATDVSQAIVPILKKLGQVVILELDVLDLLVVR